MKKILLCYLLFITMANIQAQSFSVKILFKDGTTRSISVADIAEVYFEDINAEARDHPQNVELIRTLFLFNNYPNPFNPSTTIKYSLSKPATVQVDIYNITGDIVKSFSRDKQDPGEYTVQWDGTDQRNVKVATGVYIFCIKAGQDVLCKRMTFIK